MALLEDKTKGGVEACVALVGRVIGLLIEEEYGIHTHVFLADAFRKIRLGGVSSLPKKIS